MLTPAQSSRSPLQLVGMLSTPLLQTVPLGEDRCVLEKIKYRDRKAPLSLQFTVVSTFGIFRCCVVGDRYEPCVSLSVDHLQDRL